MTEKTPVPARLTLVGHLEELRTCLFFCLAYLAAGTVLGFIAAPELVKLIKLPMRGIIDTLIVTKPTEAVAVYVKLALYAGAVIASPFICYQVWRFIKPAVPLHLSIPFISWFVPTIGLFLLGTALTYLFIIPVALRFLVKLTVEIATPMFTLNGYVSFILALVMLGGLIFEMPVLSALLARIGVLTPAMMRRRRREAVLAMIVAAAVLTPTTDAFTMFLFVAPMIILYEVSIITAVFVLRSMHMDYEALADKKI